MTPEFARLLDRARTDVKVAQAVARVDSALQLDSERPGERWDVDLSEPRFTWREGDTVLFSGPCQLIGTWVEGDGLLWGFENSSVGPSGTGELRARLEALDDVREALATRAFAVSRDDAQLVCTSLAVRAGYTGCFAGPTGRAVAMLAVQLTGPDASGLGKGGWCTWCGALRHQRRALIAGPDGVMICDECGSRAAEVAGEEGGEDTQPLDGSSHPVLRFCVFCLTPKGGLILGPHAGLCRPCARLAGEILTGQR